MTIDYYTILLLIIAGLSSGIFVGAASGTAGMFIIPCLTIFIGYSVHQAIGTSLLVDCIIGLIAGLIFLKNSKVDLKSSFPLILTGVLGAFIGSRFTSITSESGLNIALGILLVVFGLNLLINGVRRNIKYIESKINFKFFKDHKTISFVVLGFFIGLVSGFSGMGGAAIITIVLIFILEYDVHKAIGTSLFAMFFIAGAGAIGHVVNNEVIVYALLIAGCAAGLGAFLGSTFANKINEDKLGRIIGAIIIILGLVIFIKMIFR